MGPGDIKSEHGRVVVPFCAWFVWSYDPLVRLHSRRSRDNRTFLCFRSLSLRWSTSCWNRTKTCRWCSLYRNSRSSTLSSRSAMLALLDVSVVTVDGLDIPKERLNGAGTLDLWERKKRDIVFPFDGVANEEHRGLFRCVDLESSLYSSEWLVVKHRNERIYSIVSRGEPFLVVLLVRQMWTELPSATQP